LIMVYSKEEKKENKQHVGTGMGDYIITFIK